MAKLTHLLIVTSSFFLYESCFTMASTTMPARETLSQECSLNSFSTDQQSNKITGKVVDVKGDPIIGANILIKGTTMGTITDIDGNFSINSEVKKTLVITYIGYNNQEVYVANQKPLQIVLQENARALDEVVVIGYGVQKKADLTGSVANIKADKLNTQSNANIGQALQGKIAGVDIVSEGGTPGASARIMVRGIGTLNTSTPLYVVDGMYMSSIDHINPNDIESIDVLKDASSAAIYGSRAANGVILITTKSGVDTNSKPIINFSLNTGVSSPSKYLNMLDAQGWADVTTTARKAVGLSVEDMATDLSTKENNDWQHIMLKSALIQNYNVSIKGGGKYNTYYTSAGYYNQDGTVKGTKYERYTIQSKNDWKVGHFSAGTNIVLSYNHDKPLESNSRGGMLGIILQTIPTLSRYDSNRVGGYGGSYGDVVNIPNPLGMVDDNLMDRSSENVKAYANLYAQIEFIKGLKCKFNFTPDYDFYSYKDYNGLYNFGLTSNQVTTLNENQTKTRNILLEHLLTFDRKFGNHKVSALAGYSYSQKKYNYKWEYGEGMATGLKEIDAATQNVNSAGNSTTSVLISFLGRVFYSYKDRYLLTATIRRDGSSKFGASHRWGNFPSVSAGWNISEESFMKNAKWLDQLKFRAGYGVLGNQEIDDYLYSSTITTGINYPNGSGGLLKGAFPKAFASPDIKWEETAMTNLGIDFLALHNRLSITADYYIKNTKDILLAVPIPISSGGANTPVQNAGKIKNTGFEFNVAWNNRVNSDLSYTISANGSFNKNKVTKMGSASGSIWSGATNQNVNTEQTLANYPIGGFWLIPCQGYFNSDEEAKSYVKDGTMIQPNAKAGDIKFQDTNNDGTINDKDRVYCGSPFPDFSFGFNAGINYKRFDLSIGVQGTVGNKIFNATRQTLEDATKGTNFLSSCLDYWTESNKNAAHPRLTWDDPNQNSRASSNRYLENGSYLRLRSLQIGYAFPEKWFGGFVQSARVYLNAENLFTITGYSGYSPDVNASSSMSRGFDNFIYPNNRIFMVGLNVTL
jgi:TonB-dependent starch-binding outer membrane protein SusC